MTATVYRVTCLPTGETYIGSTVQAVGHRFSEHRSTLRAGKHRNPAMQRLWDLHGPDAFEFAAILLVREEDRAQAEQDCINARPGALNVTSPVARPSAQRRADLKAKALAAKDAALADLDARWEALHPLDSGSTLGPSRMAPEPTPSQMPSPVGESRG